MGVLFTSDKPLFVFIGLFCLAQVYFTCKRYQAFPILHYGMYSTLTYPNQPTDHISIVSNNRKIPLEKLPRNQRLRIEGISKLISESTKTEKFPIQTLIDQHFSSPISSHLTQVLVNQAIQPKRVNAYIREQLHLSSPWFLIKNSIQFKDCKPIVLESDTLMNG